MPRRGERLLPPGQIDAVGSQREPLAVGQSHHRDVEPLREQIRALLLQLPQKRRPDVADADDGERETFACLEKRLMDDVERVNLLRGVDDAGDVAF